MASTLEHGWPLNHADKKSIDQQNFFQRLYTNVAGTDRASKVSRWTGEQLISDCEWEIWHSTASTAMQGALGAPFARCNTPL